MKHIKTADLTGSALDWAVAKCIGHRVAENYGTYIRIHLPDPKQSSYTLAFCPSTDWAQGGPIIEREKFKLHCGENNIWWSATNQNPHRPVSGPTPLIAAMRCYVISEMGDEIEIPEELE